MLRSKGERYFIFSAKNRPFRRSILVYTTWNQLACPRQCWPIWTSKGLCERKSQHLVILCYQRPIDPGPASARKLTKTEMKVETTLSHLSACTSRLSCGGNELRWAQYASGKLNPVFFKPSESRWQFRECTPCTEIGKVSLDLR